VSKYTVYANGDFHARGWGTFVGSYRDASGAFRSGTYDYRVVVNGSPATTGLIVVHFQIVSGTDGLANLHGQIREVIDLRTKPPTIHDVVQYHFDP
jgi:hypothetical protein